MIGTAWSRPERHRPAAARNRRYPRSAVVIDLGIGAEPRQQPHDHAAVAVDCALGDAAMMSKPVLIDGDLRVDVLGRGRRRRERASVHEEPDESAHAAHVIGGNAALPSGSRAAAAVAREVLNNILTDLAEFDLVTPQPIGEMPGGILVARDRRWSALSGFQRRNECFNERLQQRRIHTMGANRKTYL